MQIHSASISHANSAPVQQSASVQSKNNSKVDEYVPSRTESDELFNKINDEKSYIERRIEFMNPESPQYQQGQADIARLETSSLALEQMWSIATSDDDKAEVYKQATLAFEQSVIDFPQDTPKSVSFKNLSSKALI